MTRCSGTVEKLWLPIVRRLMGQAKSVGHLWSACGMTKICGMELAQDIGGLMAGTREVGLSFLPLFFCVKGSNADCPQARYGQKEKWPKTISTCLKMTQEQDEVDFWLDMMIMSGVGLPHFHLPPPPS